MTIHNQWRYKVLSHDGFFPFYCLYISEVLSEGLYRFIVCKQMKITKIEIQSGITQPTTVEIQYVPATNLFIRVKKLSHIQTEFATYITVPNSAIVYLMLYIILIYFIQTNCTTQQPTTRGRSVIGIYRFVVFTKNTFFRLVSCNDCDLEGL